MESILSSDTEVGEHFMDSEVTNGLESRLNYNASSLMICWTHASKQVACIKPSMCTTAKGQKVKSQKPIISYYIQQTMHLLKQA